MQVKSRATPAVLADYLDRFERSGMDRLFFVCHSPAGALSTDRPGVHLWLGEALADQALKAGLLDWLIHKAR